MNQDIQKLVICGSSAQQFRTVQRSFDHLPLKLLHINVVGRRRVNTGSLPDADRVILITKFIDHKTAKRVTSQYGRARILYHNGGLARLKAQIADLVNNA